MTIKDAKRNRSVLLVYYSARSRDRLETMLRSQGAEVYAVPGRALDAAERVRRHPKDLAVVDKDVTDISVSQATRRVGQILPSTLVFAVGGDRQTVEVYKNGRQIGAIGSDEIAHFASAESPAEARPRELTTEPAQEHGRRSRPSSSALTPTGRTNSSQRRLRRWRSSLSRGCLSTP